MLTQISEPYRKFPKATSKQKYTYALYKCECGIEKEILSESVDSGITTSCGCYQRARLVIRNTTHGMSKHRLYRTWLHIIERCTDAEHKHYKSYGGRGIAVCSRWLDVRLFIEDMFPSYREELSIDRIDNNLGYSKENCRWATKAVQVRNTRLLRENNTSGYRGVCFDKNRGKFTVSISVSRKRVNLGRFTTALEAAITYDTYVIANNLEHTINGVIQ